MTVTILYFAGLREALVASTERLLSSPALNQGLPVVANEGQKLVRSFFRAGLMLIGILLVGLLLVLTAYRWVSVRIQPARK